MKNKLVPIKVSGLTNAEAAALIIRHIDDIATLGTTLIADTILKSYLAGLTSKAPVFKIATDQLKENADSKKIELADKKRDKSERTFRKAVDLAADSDVAAEVEAARLLTILLNNYKGITNVNYESETLGLDNMISALESAAYSKAVASLALGKYVTRIKNDNNAFKALFTGRSSSTAMSVHYDTKALRSDIYAYYKEFSLYLQSMANATNAEQYIKVLSMVNNGRKYFADQMERRLAINEANKENNKATDPASTK